MGEKFVCRMWRINICATVVLVLLELTMSAMVLPRPPSSHPNRIRQNQDLSARKALEGKSLHGVPAQDINVDRPEDYRYYIDICSKGDLVFVTPLFFHTASR